MRLITSARAGALALSLGALCAVGAAPAAARELPLRIPGVQHRVPARSPRSAHVRAASTTSTNWSGYAVTGSTYSSVVTSWVQPSVNCSKTPSSYAAFWDGIDGYSSNSVEQTGTLAECSASSRRRASTASYSGWYEMYPNPMYTFGGTVKPGDVMTATTAADGGGEFTLTLSDATENWSKSTTQTSSSAARSSAEVITEAPSSGSGVLPLADFGTMNYSSTEVDGSAISSSTPGLEEITMDSSSGALEAQPSSLGNGGAFSVTWYSK